jgi:putative ABC transport system ATP-binding protein
VIIELHHVTKTFGTGSLCRAVNDLSSHVRAGVLGDHGAERMWQEHDPAPDRGLTAPTSGKIIVDGVDFGPMTPSQAAALRRRRIGYVMQAFNLPPYLTVEENVGLPLMLDGVRDSEIRQRRARHSSRRTSRSVLPSVRRCCLAVSSSGSPSRVLW